MRSLRDVRYTYRLRVSKTAARALEKEWDGVRWVWNQCVEESKKAYEASTPEHKVTCGPAELDKLLTGWRGEHEWLAEGSSVPQQQVVRDFGKARAKALSDMKNRVPVTKRRGLPRFKSRHRAKPSLQYTKNGFSLKEDGSGRLRLHLAGGVVVRPVWSRALPSAPSSVRVYQDSVGDWWASFVVKVHDEPLPATGRAIGIDWGVRAIATTTTDAFDLSHREHGKSAAAKLARYQKMMARRKPEPGHEASKGYEEAKRQTARVHRKVAWQRQDDGRKWAKSVVCNFDQMAVEDFSPKFLAKSTMAKKAADAAIATTKRELSSMAAKHCRELSLVPPPYTTMDCSSCGARTKHRLGLSQRIFACTSCGDVMHRDKNAAANMVARAGFVPAGAESVRPEPQLAARAV